MNIFYIIETIILFLIILLVKKSEQKLNAIKSILYVITFIGCFNLLSSLGLSYFKIPITLEALSILNGILLLGILIKIIKDKEIQKYYIDLKDVVFAIIAICLVIPIAIKAYGSLDKICYITTDAKVHFSMSKAFYAQDTVFIKDKIGFMPFLYVNEGILYKVFTPIIGEFNLYKIFLLSDILIWFVSIITFYFVLKNRKNNLLEHLIIYILSIVFALGYPLNSMLTGFHYLQSGINMILLLTILFKEERLNEKWKTLCLIYINISIIFTYNLFAIIVYPTELIYLLICNYKEKHRILDKNVILKTIVGLIIPGIIAIIYFLLPVLINKNTMYGLEADGYIYRNTWSTIIIFFIISICYIIKKINRNEYSYPIILMLGTILWYIIFFILLKNKIIASYYFYKLYYLIWPIIISLSTLYLIETLNKKKYIALIGILIYILLMILSIIRINYVFPTDYKEGETESYKTVFGIFNINKKMLEFVPILEKEEIECLEYINENRIDTSSSLFIDVARQEEWKKELIYTSIPCKFNIYDLNGELKKWEEGNYKYLVLFKNTNVYEILKDNISLQNAQLIFENEKTQIWENDFNI